MRLVWRLIDDGRFAAGLAVAGVEIELVREDSCLNQLDRVANGPDVGPGSDRPDEVLPVRLLGMGELKAKVAFSVWGASKSAVAAVEKAGGSVAILAPKTEPSETAA